MFFCNFNQGVFMNIKCTLTNFSLGALSAAIFMIGLLYLNNGTSGIMSLFSKQGGIVVVPSSESSSEEYFSPVFKKEDGSKVLARFKNGLVITEKGFDNYLEEALPKMGLPINKVNQEMKKSFFSGVLDMAVIEQATSKNVYASPEYAQNLADTIKMVKQNSVAEAFTKKIQEKVKVDSSKVREEYEEFKERYIKVPGGVTVYAAKFDALEDCDKFFKEFEQTAMDFGAFEKMVKDDSKATLRNFDRISKLVTRGAPKKIIDKLETLSSFPSAFKISVEDDQHWVVLALDKKETEYASFDEVSKRIEMMLSQKAMQGMIQEKLTQLKKEMIEKIDKSYESASIDDLSSQMVDDLDLSELDQE